MENNNKPVSLCALWRNKSKNGTEFFTGKLGDARIIAFWNDRKTNENQPDLRIYVDPTPPQTPKLSQPQPNPSINEDDLPF